MTYFPLVASSIIIPQSEPSEVCNNRSQAAGWRAARIAAGKYMQDQAAHIHTQYILIKYCYVFFLTYIPVYMNDTRDNSDNSMAYRTIVLSKTMNTHTSYVHAPRQN